MNGLTMGTGSEESSLRRALAEILGIASYGSELTIEEMGERLNAIENLAQGALDK